MPQPYGTECCSGEVDVCRGGRVARFRDMMDGDSDNGNGQREPNTIAGSGAGRRAEVVIL